VQRIRLDEHAITDQLIEISCATWDLSDPQRLCQSTVVADAESLQILHALVSTQDSEHGHQEQVLGRNAHAAP
jgi:hypothetical protein